MRFFYVPVQAREPQPADGAKNVSVATDLTWRPGREAQSHKVYFGVDADAVAAGTVPAATQTEHSYTPASLEFGTTYYWKVDEVGDTGTYEGNLWSFTTQEYATIEDFESYNDKSTAASSRPGSTAVATGTPAPPWATRRPPRGPSARGPSCTAAVSRCRCSTTTRLRRSTPRPERDFATAQDWTDNGANALALYLRGNAAGFQETAGGR